MFLLAPVRVGFCFYTLHCADLCAVGMHDANLSCSTMAVLYVHIHNISNFGCQEAEVLWEKIKARQGLNKWRPDLEEEYEDQEGNIYNKKTYTDLQRQGLI